jgi:hypothetical protein
MIRIHRVYTSILGGVPLPAPPYAPIPVPPLDLNDDDPARHRAFLFCTDSERRSPWQPSPSQSMPLPGRISNSRTNMGSTMEHSDEGGSTLKNPAVRISGNPNYWTSIANVDTSERDYTKGKAGERLLNHTGAPDFVWIWAYQYLALVNNWTADRTLRWKCPHTKRFGVTPDISVLLSFHFYESVYYLDMEEQTPCHVLRRKQDTGLV